MKKTHKQVIKKGKKKLIKIIFGIIIFTIFLLSRLKYFPKTKAQITEFNFKIKIQGDFRNKKDVIYKALIVFYSPYEKIYEFKNQEFTLVEDNIFSTKISISNFDKNNIYSFFIKPENYLGRIFSNYIIEKDINDINLTKEYFYGGDLFPYDGEVSAYDLSKIFKNLGKKIAETDLNKDGTTDTQDYFMALYTLKNNFKEDRIQLLPKPTTTPTPIPTLTPNITSAPTLTLTPTTNLISNTPIITANPTPSLTPTLTPTNPPTNTPIQADNKCPQMDNGLPNSTLHYPSGSTSLPSTTKEVCALNTNNYYSLPYRNPNCLATENGIRRAYERMRTYYPTYFSRTKLLTDWKTVQHYAVKYNFNPLFVISLWIEESAAGGATDAQQLGCLFRLNKDGTWTALSETSTICEQLECLFGYPQVNPSNYARWACPYRFGLKGWQNDRCSEAIKFTRVIDFWYNYIAENLPSSCQIRYYSPADQGCSQ